MEEVGDTRLPTIPPMWVGVRASDVQLRWGIALNAQKEKETPEPPAPEPPAPEPSTPEPRPLTPPLRKYGPQYGPRPPGPSSPGPEPSGPELPEVLPLPGRRRA